MPLKTKKVTNKCPLKVLHIITGLNPGGAETMLLKLLERLNRARFEPRVISLTTLGKFGPRIAALGIPVEALRLKPNLPNPLMFFRLLTRIRSLKPEVVQTWMYHADFFGGLAARLAGVSAVAWGIRNSNLDRDKTNLRTRLVVLACAAASHWLPKRILSCSKGALQVHAFLGYAEKKMCVVPNGFDLSRFRVDAEARQKIRAELDIANDAPVVGVMGRFDPQKNHVGFFQAAGLLHRKLPQVQFILAGLGIDESNEPLMRAIRQADVLSNTHLLGLRDDMQNLMATLDVLVSFSTYGEAFPNVLGEAMACGVPCVATDVGDSAYIVGNTGSIVAINDIVGLMRAVETLLDSPMEKRAALGERARERVAANFEIGQVVHQYEDFYLTLYQDT